MTLPEEQLTCTRPFEWFEVHPDGSVFLCCPAWLKRPIGNLLTEPVDKIWNGPIAQEIRKSVLNGSFHNCSRKRCPFLHSKIDPVCETSTMSDQRVQKSILAKETALPYLPGHLNLCFDHSCNLVCPSCRKQLQIADGKDLIQAEDISRILQRELLPYAHSITLSGFGDPFGSPTYFKLLTTLNQETFPNLKRIRLHTNGQLLTEKKWKSLPNLWPQVKEIEISVDAATEKTYRLNRPGASFEQLLKNLEYLSTTNCELTLSMVVQQNNWREVPDFIKLAKRFGAKAYLSQLVNWGTFSQKEYMKRAVHQKNHPENEMIKSILIEIKKSNSVVLGNLT